jgi:hypothetical protein
VIWGGWLDGSRRALFTPRRVVLVALAVAAVAAAAAVALGSSSAPAATGLDWSAAATLPTCGAPVDPRVVFPESAPNVGTGPGAIAWLGSRCPTGTTTLDAAVLSGDEPGPPRALTAGPLASFEALAGTTHGQLVAVVGAGGRALLGEGLAEAGFAGLRSLTGSDALVATQTGFIGDVDVATVAGADILVRAQRHFMRRFGRAVRIRAGARPPSALAIGMDFRADRLIVWDEQGELYARYVTNRGHVKREQRLGPAGSDPQISVVLSDDDRAFVIWTDEPPVGSAGIARVLVAHSAVGPRFHGVQTLASFPESATVRLPAGAVAAVRLSSEGVALLWPARSASGELVLDGASARQYGVLRPRVVAVAGMDVHLGAVASGPRNELVALLEVEAHDSGAQAIYAVRSNVVRDPGGLGFGAPVELARPGANFTPAVAVDPETDAVIAAWQSGTAIDWARGTPSG